MNTEIFIARKLITSKDNRKSISRSILNIAIFGISLGLAVMIVAMAVVTGFKNEISRKVVGFAAHIQILNFDSNISFETQPISSEQEFLTDLKEDPSVASVQVFATKAGIIKTKSDIQGVVLKGVGPGYDWGFLRDYLQEGEILTLVDSARSNKVLISRYIASLLKLNINDDFLMYFIQEPPRMRRFTVTGIFETSLEEFDKVFIFGDIRHIQKLNDWTEKQISGFEVNLTDFSDLEKQTYMVMNKVGFGFEEDGSRLKVINIHDKYPQIFDWLNLQDMNVLIILILILVVAGFNMVSGLLILILDRTNMIGILKALGSPNVSIRKIFMYQSGFLIIRGLFWGNIIGIGICLLQKFTGIMELDQSSYYLNTVPVNLNALHIIALNLGTALAIILMLIIPSMIISRISPAMAIRFE
ncbi:MAG: ABC transporter permease [Bacteroidales bacterium]|nr:ABC transporter permease [Bacteroidales bacterium]